MPRMPISVLMTGQVHKIVSGQPSTPACGDAK
jgi:hypothetical protein